MRRPAALATARPLEVFWITGPSEIGWRVMGVTMICSHVRGKESRCFKGKSKIVFRFCDEMTEGAGKQKRRDRRGKSTRANARLLQKRIRLIAS
jgi:hypothetical protein